MIPEKSKIPIQLRWSIFRIFARGAMGAERVLRTATYHHFG
jgi:hypothetical protein